MIETQTALHARQNEDNDRSTVQAVILAAGRGSRLGSAIKDGPKCLAQVGGRSLIEHQLDLLAEAGITRVAVTTGYRAAEVRKAVAGRAEVIHNHDWGKTEGLHSLYLCRDWVTGPLVVLNCDVLLEADMLSRLLETGPDTLHFDSSSGD
ncbi:MAG: NTP transferase domain-containing protein, partial [Pyrinomonadaceae bacterium]